MVRDNRLCTALTFTATQHQLVRPKNLPNLRRKLSRLLPEERRIKSFYFHPEDSLGIPIEGVSHTESMIHRT